MISPTDILAHITNGRTEAETARALSLSHTLAGTEDMIREMMQAAPPVTVEVGNTADLADLAEMRDMLDGADWPPTPIGLWEALKRADEADELDRDHAKALAETVAVRAERDALAAEVTALRAEVAALTPGPWARVGDQPPQDGDAVLMWAGEGSAPWIRIFRGPLVQCVSADYLWRPIPAGLLTPPETAETVAP